MSSGASTSRKVTHSPSSKLRLIPKSIMGDPNESVSEIFSIKYSPDGQYIAAACGDAVIRVYNTSTGRLAYSLTPTGKFSRLPVTNLRFRPANLSQKTKNILLASYAEGIVRHWHVTSSKCLHTISEPDNNIYAIDYTSDALKFCSAGKDFKLRLYDESTKQLVSTLTGGQNDTTVGHANRVFSLKFHPKNENLIISGGWDDTIQVWDVRIDQAVRSIFGPHICGDSVDAVGNEILSGSWRPDHQLQLWDFGTGKLIRDIPWAKSTDEPCLLYAAQFSHGNDGELIAAAGSGSNEARIFDKKTATHLGTVTGIPKGSYSLDFDPSNKHLAVAGADALIRVVTLQWSDEGK
eukprot:TRINITY_DN568_c0_g1_i1.p1 TRINITY_DN568_c0_g1~~TRINITY_DN568_c0_g1_i1.p1  ORF type:complete len:350 (+),score=59.43 TRINITY_DN568_c0_g1_i1:100-1149(+)